MLSNDASNSEKNMLGRSKVNGPSGPTPCACQSRVTDPSPIRSKTTSSFARRWNAAMSGTSGNPPISWRKIVVSPLLIAATSGLVTRLVTGTEDGSTPSTPRIPVSRS